MKEKIKIRYYSPTAFQAWKGEVWQVCQQMFNISEQAFYDRLSTFKYFAVFTVAGQVVGFQSFFLDEVPLQGKRVVLVGSGHGGILPEHRQRRIFPTATVLFIFRRMLRHPFRRYFLWGLAMTHLSYRMGVRSTEFHYPPQQGDWPPFFKAILDWIGHRYYAETYDDASFTAKVRFAATGDDVIPSEVEKQDPVVANFIRRVPTSLEPGNTFGALSVSPVRANLWVWFKKFGLGVR
ncbi:MAG TPA: hypothetical protein DCP28_24595 [Cytophagales bacterium]|nr:hypothetical protein [Cytophagales bacterium]